MLQQLPRQGERGREEERETEREKARAKERKQEGKKKETKSAKEPNVPHTSTVQSAPNVLKDTIEGDVRVLTTSQPTESHARVRCECRKHFKA